MENFNCSDVLDAWRWINIFYDDELPDITERGQMIEKMLL